MLTESDLKQHLVSAKNIILTTHKNSDGDGIGSLAGLCWALASIGKKVTFFHNDEIPARYSFLTDGLQKVFFTSSTDQKTLSEYDLVIVLDTHQGDLCNPLFDRVCALNKSVIFIDHHLTQKTNLKNCFYFVDPSAASTGEIVYNLIEKLNITITKQIAKALYSSLTFDTQAFKLTRNSYRSHLIASELVKYDINTESIQRALFANWTVKKMNFLAVLIQNSKNFKDGHVIGLTISQKDLDAYDLEGDDVSDLLDLFTLIKTVEFCYCIREIESNYYKISFRSIGNKQAFEMAELFAGGGHGTSAGAWVRSDLLTIENKIKHFLKI